MLGDPDSSLNITEQAEEKSGLGFESGADIHCFFDSSKVDIFRKRVRDEPDVSRVFPLLMEALRERRGLGLITPF